MRYVEVTSENEKWACYEAYRGEQRVARFAWEACPDKIVLIREIRMEPGCGSFENVSGVLEFIQYKAMAEKADAMQLEFPVKNRRLADMLLRFGFYVIDRHYKEGGHGQEEMTCVMKCTIR